MIKAVIFDMDGLMLDSEPIQSRAFEMIIREYGKEPIFTETGVVQTIGVCSRENWEQLKLKHDIEEELEILIEKRRVVYQELLQKFVEPRPGLLNLLALLKKHSFKIALASSSHMENIELVLSGLHVKDYFQVITSGEMLKKGKPAPDIFLKAAEMLHLKPSDCLVLEDAESGVKAAKAAGMKVIAVPNKYTKQHDFSEADNVVDSLQKVTWSILSRY